MLKITITIEPFAHEATSAESPRITALVEQLAPLLASLLKPAVPPVVVLPKPPALSTAPLEPGHPFVPDASVGGDGPSAPTAETNARAASEARRQAKLTEGYETFAGLIHCWSQGFGVEGFTQPDRAAALRAIIDSPSKAGSTLMWIAQQGGLRKAVRVTTNPGKQSDAYCDRMAENITQVASALSFSDLAELLEPSERLPILTPQ